MSRRFAPLLKSRFSRWSRFSPRLAAILLAVCSTLLRADPAQAATTYTFTPTAAGTYSWTDSGNWDVSGVPVGATDATVRFWADTTTDAGNHLTINNDPTTLTLNTLTLNGRRWNNPSGTVTIGTAGNTWTFDGTNPTVNLNTVSTSSGTYVKIMPNLTLNQNLLFTGESNVQQGIDFAGSIADGASGTSITKSGNSYLMLSGNSTFSGGVNFQGGTLLIKSANALGSGTLTITGGRISASTPWTTDNISIPNPVTANADFSFAAQNNRTDGSLTLAGPMTLGTSGIVTRKITITIPNGSAGAAFQTISGDISNGGATTANLTLVGDNNNFPNISKLRLSGANTYTGTTTLNTGGIVTFVKPVALYNADTAQWTAAKVVANTGVTFAVGYGGPNEFTEADVTALLTGGGAGGLLLGTDAGLKAGSFFGFDTGNAAVAQSYSGNIVDSTGTGGGAVGLSKVGNGALTLSGTNTYTGPTALFAGTLNIASAAALGAGTLNIYGGTIDNTSGTAMTRNVSAQNWYGDFTFAGTDSLDLGTGLVNCGNWRNVTVTASTLTIGGVISCPYANRGPNKLGAGTLVFSGANTYTGPTTVKGGTLVVGANALSGVPGALGNAAAGVDNVLGEVGGNNNASLLIGGPYTVGRSIRLPTNNTTDAGTRVLTLGGSTADVSEFSGNIYLGTVNQAGRGVTLTAADGGKVTFSGSIQDPTGMDPTTYIVTKSGPGTVVLSGDNTYSGATTISDGTLLVNNTSGSGTGAGAVIVNAGTLGGTGEITGAVTVNADGILAPGAGGIGTLTVDNAVTMSTGATYVWQIADAGGVAGTGWDLVAVTGDLTLDDNWTLKLVDAGTTPIGGVEYDLFTYSGGNFYGNLAEAVIDYGTTGWANATVNQAAGRIYVKFGSNADANGDGVVDAADYIYVKERFGNAPTAGEDGDLDSSGVVDFADLQILMNALNPVVDAPAIPEPATLGLLAIGALVVLRRRRA